MLRFEANPEKPRVFDPVWKCIYCGWNSDINKLSREHIIPYGLSGSFILQRASCPRCSNITRDFETVCLKQVLQQFRTHTNIKSRKKTSLKELPIRTTVDGRRIEKLVPIAQHPQILVLPVYERPGILIGRDPLIKTQKGGAMVWRDEDEFRRRLKLHGDEAADTTVPVPFIPEAFGRMLAKIAYSFAVAVFGMHTFHPFVINTILNPKTPYTIWVGSAARDIEGDGLHLIDAYRSGSEIGRDLLSVLVRLFPEYGMPTYEVVVGEILPGRTQDFLDPPGLKPPKHNSGRLPSTTS